MDTKIFILFCCITLVHVQAEEHSDHGTPSPDAPWSYHGNTGPEYWTALSSGALCGGDSQSPIDIQPDSAVETAYEPWTLTGYDNDDFNGPHPSIIMNNGHSLEVDLEGDYLASGGGLPSTYTAIQFHLHWGSDSSKGSEHTVDGKAYAAELHVVHYDSVNYPAPFLAITRPQGLAVLGFFIEVGEHNDAWDPIFDHISEITYSYAKYELQEGEQFKVSSLIPSDLSKFHRYNGSLTTPGCYESVVWTVFEETIKMSEEQLNALRGLSELKEASADGHEEPLVDNYRPVQSLNARTVYHGTADMADEDLDESSCANRCGVEYDEGFPCQCDLSCRQWNNCCEDYKENCLVEVCSFVPTFKDKQRKHLRKDE